jgi:hypothetical protein
MIIKSKKDEGIRGVRRNGKITRRSKKGKKRIYFNSGRNKFKVSPPKYNQ